MRALTRTLTVLLVVGFVSVSILWWMSERTISKLRDEIRDAESAKIAKNRPKLANQAPTSDPTRANGKPAPLAVSPTPESRLADFLSGYSEIDHIMLQRAKWAAIAKSEGVIGNLALEADKKAKLRDIIFARTQAEKDSRDIAEKTGMSAKERVAATNQARALSEQEIANLLGPIDYSNYRVAVAAESARTSMYNNKELLGSLIEANVPLSNSQIESLAKTFYQISDAAKNVETTERSSLDAHAATLSSASAYLSPEQIAALKKYLEVDRELGVQLKKVVK